MPAGAFGSAVDGVFGVGSAGCSTVRSGAAGDSTPRGGGSGSGAFAGSGVVEGVASVCRSLRRSEVAIHVTPPATASARTTKRVVARDIVGLRGVAPWDVG